VEGGQHVVELVVVVGWVVCGLGLLVLEKILKHAIYNIFMEVETILSSSLAIPAHVKLKDQ